tara:strand:- start:489 stop:785 length:297 start_codon:yes stop_codon:yes gene_type:complete
MPGHYDKVGQGYAGLGKQELNRRMKQHKAIRDKALGKSMDADKMYKEMGKLIGQFGSQKDFPTDAAYRTLDHAFVTRQAQLQKAVKFNKGLKKLGLNK